MKINDKSLSTFAVSVENINKEGLLFKKGAVNHSYKKRWFVLKGNLLFYFEKQNDKQPLGMIILENCSVEISDTERYSFCIRFQALGSVGASRTYILCADNENDMEHWIKTITSASYTYTSMVVKEFEKTLERLKSTSDINDNAKGPDCNILEFMETKQALCPATDIGDMHERKLSCEDHIDSSKNAMKQSSKNLLENNKLVNDYELVSKTKSSFDMYTVTSANSAKTKYKTLNTVRRSKSSENVDKLYLKSSGSKGKSRIQTLKRPQTFLSTTLSSDSTSPVSYELEKTTFEILHTSFGAAIWTKIGETL